MNTRTQEKYRIGLADFYSIRNRNELRVLRMMKKIFDEPGMQCPPQEPLYDIYALALNKLPARYAQQGSIVLRDPIRDEDVLDAVRNAVTQVLHNPKQ